MPLHLGARSRADLGQLALGLVDRKAGASTPLGSPQMSLLLTYSPGASGEDEVATGIVTRSRELHWGEATTGFVRGGVRQDRLNWPALPEAWRGPRFSCMTAMADAPSSSLSSEPHLCQKRSRARVVASWMWKRTPLTPALLDWATGRLVGGWADACASRVRTTAAHDRPKPGGWDPVAGPSRIASGLSWHVEGRPGGRCPVGACLGMGPRAAASPNESVFPSRGPNLNPTWGCRRCPFPMTRAGRRRVDRRASRVRTWSW